MRSTEAASKGAGSQVPSSFGRSRPPLGAIHSSLPPCRRGGSVCPHRGLLQPQQPIPSGRDKVRNTIPRPSAVNCFCQVYRSDTCMLHTTFSKGFHACTSTVF